MNTTKVARHLRAIRNDDPPFDVPAWTARVRALASVLTATDLALTVRLDDAPARFSRSVPACWRASVVNAHTNAAIESADGKTAEEAAGALVATLERRIAQQADQHRAQLARLTGATRAGA